MLAREPSTHEPSQGPFSGSGKESQSVKIPANNSIKTNIVIETSSLASVPPLCDLDLFSGGKNLIYHLLNFYSAND